MYKELAWEQLIPEDELAILLNPPDSVYDIADGSAMDNIEVLNGRNEEDSKYFAALKSFNVVEAFKDKKIKLPGFIVPLTVDEKNKVTEFFVVPYFGACLHMPPPPPNQVVFIKLKDGIVLKSLYDPYWFEGTLKVSRYTADVGASAYSIEVDKYYPYDQ